jgi:hypothetical protein
VQVEGRVPVRVVNPEGCRSLAPVFVDVKPSLETPDCGLLGIEPLPLLGFLLARRARRRWGRQNG